MLVGEQPGDAEDERGRPFVGPAGQLLRDVLAEVGIEKRLSVTKRREALQVAPAKAADRDKPNWSRSACDHWLA